MIKKDDVIFVEEALVAGAGDIDLKLILIADGDGGFRQASGRELAIIAEHYPNFIKGIKRRLGRDDADEIID